jgi:hypothetical protein
LFFARSFSCFFILSRYFSLVFFSPSRTWSALCGRFFWAAGVAMVAWRKIENGSLLLLPRHRLPFLRVTLVARIDYRIRLGVRRIAAVTTGPVPFQARPWSGHLNHRIKTVPPTYVLLRCATHTPWTMAKLRCGLMWACLSTGPSLMSSLRIYGCCGLQDFLVPSWGTWDCSCCSKLTSARV